MTTRDFDQFMAERGEARMMVRILGRDCQVARELPWPYMLKVERMLRTGEPISGQDNIDALKGALSPEDFEYITGHPQFRASWFWEIIAFAWLRADDNEKARTPRFTTEDDVRVEKTRAGRSKKRRSAR